MKGLGCCKTWTLDWTRPGDLETGSPESTFFFHFSFFLHVIVFFISKCDILNRVTIL